MISLITRMCLFHVPFSKLDGQVVQMRLSGVSIGSDNDFKEIGFTGSISLESPGHDGRPLSTRRGVRRGTLRVILTILLASILIASSLLAFFIVSENPSTRSSILNGSGEESVVTRVYDLFNVPLGSWWSDRYQEQVIQSTFPVAYEWFGNPAGNTYIYSDYRMNVTAKNISKVNTSDDPWYVPTLNPTVRGGNITLDWYANYLTKSEAIADYLPTISNWYDGWFWRWNGTVTMDRTAAKMVLDMTDTEFDNFATWKASSFSTFKQKFSSWIQDQMNAVWAIKYAYEFEGITLFESYDIQKVGNNIVFKILDHLSWGVESLLGRWWSHTFMDFEGCPEDVHFTAQIGPASSNFNLDMAVQYSLFAATGTRDDRPCWTFETTHADAVYGSSGTYASEFNKYYGESNWCKLIANSNYQKWRDYDYTPWAWNLNSDNHKIIIEWPDSSAIIGYQYNGTNDYSNTIVGKVTPLWVEPLPGELPSNVQVNSTSRTIEITGPLDAWTWSKTTSSIPELQENWTRVGYLPRGCPYVEFVVNNDANQPPIITFDVPAYVATGANIALDGSGSWDPDGSIISYVWDFGDGSPNGNGAVVFHTWVIPSNYTVTLTVTDNSSQSSPLSKDVQVVYTLDPVAVITGDSNGAVGELMQFDGLSSYDPDGSIASYLWEFSDGRTFSGPIAYHVFADYGNYFVNLTVTDDLGATNAASLLVIIGLRGPVAKIAMPDKATEDRDVLLSGAQSYFFGDRPDIHAPGRTIVNYSWDFGDGSVGYGVDKTHQWASTGSYIVTLSVKDDGGNWSRPVCAVIEIHPAGAAAIGVSLSRHSLLPSEATSLTLSIVDECGNVVTDFTGDVSVACNESTGVTIPVGHAFVLGDAGVWTFAGGVSFASDGPYNVSASVDADPTILGYDFATVCNRTVETRIYDIFQGTLPDYWLKRSQYYSLGEEGFRNTSPVVGIFRSGVNTAGQLWTTYMMNVEARNIPEINMSSPTFTALRNPTTGKGNATVDLDYHMLTQAQVLALDGVYIAPGQSANWDGWEYFLTCNITMDRAATEQIINLPSASWASQADVDAWWVTNNLTVSRVWNRNVYLTEPGYLGAEGGYGASVGRLDLKSCEGYYNYGQGLWNSMFRLVYIDSEHVSLSYWNVGYGYDNLLSRFLYWGGIGSGANYPNGTPNGIVPFEPWYDNMSLRVDISDDHANVSMYGGVIYGFRAWESDAAPAGTAIWRWETMRLDCLVSLPGGKSEMDIYHPYRNNNDPRYELRDPGSSLRGMTAKYDYVPAVVTLKPGESLVIEEPRSMAVGYRLKGMTGDPTDGGPLLGGYYDSLRMLERFGNATIHAIGTPAGTAAIDARTGDLKIVGPFVPIIKYRSDIAWLVDEPAPRIELWVGPMEVHAPCAAFTVTPATGDNTTVFNFNASFSCDVEDTPDQLEFRWDWTGDGVWDTSWSNITSATQNFPLTGNYSVWLEVRDSSGLTNITETLVQVGLLPSSSQFSPPHSDHGVDTNANGLYDWLNVDVVVAVHTAGWYDIYGDLWTTGFGSWIDSGSSYIYLNAGNQTVTLQFSGIDIYNEGYSGSFDVYLNLYDDFSNWLDDDTHTTGWYNFTAFEHTVATALFAPPHSDHGVDTNANGLWDWLNVDVVVDVATAGWYQINGDLWLPAMASWVDSDSSYSYLNTGFQTVTLQFSGINIYNEGYIGVFDVFLNLYDDSWNWLDGDTHTTGWYNFTAFEQPSHFQLPHSDYGVSTSGSALFEYLVVDTTVDIKAAGTYTVLGVLWDMGNMSTPIAVVINTTYLGVGTHLVQLWFTAGSIISYGVDGPYGLMTELMDDMSNLLDTNMTLTNSYTLGQFQVPPAMLEPPHSDYGEDTNANGFYDYLVVNVTVNVTTPGWYTVAGDLNDMMLSFIDTASNYTYLTAGVHTVQLRFDGTLIFTNGLGGPYIVLLSLDDNSGNMISSGFYITYPYVAAQFERVGMFVLPHSDYGVDTGGSAAFEYLVVDTTVDINVAGTYTVIGALSLSSNMTPFAVVINTTYLGVGTHLVQLWFPAGSIISCGVDGPYGLETILMDDLSHFLDMNTTVTNPYTLSQFQVPPAMLEPPHTDYGEDTNANVLFDYLVVNVTVNVTTAGWYTVAGDLSDMALNSIDSASNYTYLTAGVHTVQLRFDGTLIFTNGVNGPYYVFLSLDDISSTLISSGFYMTNPYAASQFESGAGGDITPPTTTIGLAGTLGSNGWYVSDVTVTLTRTDNVGGSGVNYTKYSIGGGAWLTYTVPFSMSTVGTHTVDFYSVDFAGNIEGTKTTTVKIDKTAPTGSVTINSGAAYTISTSVTLTLTASDATSGINQVRYSNDGTTWSAWEAFSASKAWTLSAGDGAKTVYYQVRNGAGLVSTFTDGITLDATAPTSTASKSGSTVTISSSDATSGVNKTLYRIDGGAWLTYTGAFDVTATGNHTIEYYSIDKAGNAESVKTIYVNNSGGGISGIGDLTPMLLLFGVIAAAIAISLFFLAGKRKKKRDGAQPPQQPKAVTKSVKTSPPPQPKAVAISVKASSPPQRRVVTRTLKKASPPPPPPPPPEIEEL